MLKWVVVVVVLVLVTGLLREQLARWLHLGRLPGDLNLQVRGRSYRLPFTSTLLLSLCAWLILRII